MAKMDKDNDKKSMDISKPGKSLPDTSSRPVLVTHRPMVQDPMVKAEVKEEEPVVAEEPKSEEPKSPEPKVAEITPPSRDKKVIQPLSESEASSESPESSEASKEEPAKDKASETDEAKQAAAEAAVVEAVASQAQSRSGKKNGELSEQDKAKQEHLQKLITDKTYFVTVGQVSRRHHRRVTIALLVFMLLVLGGSYAAIDAGIIPTNIDLPVDLIKN